MKRSLILAVILSVHLTPVAAQEKSEGETLMERGLELFFEGLRDQMSPALESMRELAEEYGPALSSFLEEMGPAFGRMLDQVQDWSAYEPPEILPNGDIIIRKKPQPETPVEPEDPPPAGQTDI
ncbi:hypothetical protein [Sedimentitalea arenosa]|uniref:AAA+ family ATPase n=1 Tax=Sedimentitalea arenosa TaxID=2798803 RepID=A0A8J7ILM3_9RHOB|nr:hypothetical protein [Arenibacterium arenosum]MBJ6370231.1 hypothetical protein [Arenibacterium arenosum]